MKTIFATFNFKSADLASAEKAYLENHVRLTLQLPNLRQYITGVIRPNAERPMPRRAAFNYFDDEAAMRLALHGSAAAKLLLQDGAEHLRVNRWLELGSEIIVPFEPRRPGLTCFVLATEFELGLDGDDYATAESQYVERIVNRTRQLPNLRHYMISKYQLTKRPDTMRARSAVAAMRSPLRMAMLVFDSSDALGEAFASPLGTELRNDESATITHLRSYEIDATVQM